MKRVLVTLIAIALALYGLIRVIGVATFYMQMAGLVHVSGYAEATHQLNMTLANMNETAFLPVNAISYLGYSLLMGVILMIGAILLIVRERRGLHLIFGYCALYALMFVNFRMVNTNLMNLALALALALLLGTLTQSWPVQKNLKRIERNI